MEQPQEVQESVAFQRGYALGKLALTLELSEVLKPQFEILTQDLESVPNWQRVLVKIQQMSRALRVVFDTLNTTTTSSMKELDALNNGPTR